MALSYGPTGIDAVPTGIDAVPTAQFNVMSGTGIDAVPTAQFNVMSGTGIDVVLTVQRTIACNLRVVLSEDIRPIIGNLQIQFSSSIILHNPYHLT